MIKDAAIMAFNILKEKAHNMNNSYARMKSEVRKYYHFSMYVEDGPWPITMVLLRELGQRASFKISLENFQEYYEECPAWEAIASMSCYD